MLLMATYLPRKDVWDVTIWESPRTLDILHQGEYNVIRGPASVEELCAVETADITLNIRGFKALPRGTNPVIPHANILRVW